MVAGVNDTVQGPLMYNQYTADLKLCLPVGPVTDTENCAVMHSLPSDYIWPPALGELFWCMAGLNILKVVNLRLP